MVAGRPAAHGRCALAYVRLARLHHLRSERDVLVGHPEGLSPTYAELVKSNPVLRICAAPGKAGRFSGRAARDVRGASDQGPESSRSRSTRKRQAIALANAAAAGLRQYVSAAEHRDAGVLQTSEPQASVVDPAGSATHTDRAPPAAGIGAFAGLRLRAAAVRLLGEARTPRVNAEGGPGPAACRCSGP